MFFEMFEEKLTVKNTQNEEKLTVKNLQNEEKLTVPKICVSLGYEKRLSAIRIASLPCRYE